MRVIAIKLFSLLIAGTSIFWACELEDPLRCREGSKKCSEDGSTILQCENNYVVKVECGDNTRCVNGQCVSELLCDVYNYQSICRGMKQYTLCYDGFINIATCPSDKVCLRGECVVQEQARCSAGEAPVCEDDKNIVACVDQLYKVIACEGEEICYKGECVECKNDKFVNDCVEGKVRSCTNEGKFVTSACEGETFCSAGKCVECEPNAWENTCSGNELLKCSKEGKLLRESCDEHLVCDAGKCAPPKEGAACNVNSFVSVCLENSSYNCSTRGRIVTEECQRECFMYEQKATCSVACEEGEAVLYTNSCTSELINVPGNIIWGRCVAADDGRWMALPTQSSGFCMNDDLVKCSATEAKAELCVGVCVNNETGGTCIKGEEIGDPCEETTFKRFCSTDSSYRLCEDSVVVERECEERESCNNGMCTKDNLQEGDFCDDSLEMFCADNKLYFCKSGAVKIRVCDSPRVCATHKDEGIAGCANLCDEAQDAYFFTNSCTYEELGADEIIWGPCKHSDQGQNVAFDIVSKSVCKNTSRVYCEQQVLKEEPCSVTCRYDLVSKTSSCRVYTIGASCDYFSPYCENNQSIYCHEGQAQLKQCTNTELCYNGACHDKGAAIPGMPCEYTRYIDKCVDGKLASCRDGKVGTYTCAQAASCLTPTDATDANCVRLSNTCSVEGALTFYTNACDSLGQNSGNIVYGKCLKADDGNLYIFNREAVGYCESQTQFVYCENATIKRKTCNSCTNGQNGGTCS
ncbi:MAG: hypothetical protein WC966_10840 [Bradymonadales bacterium]|jgi:hypothetical protein